MESTTHVLRSPLVWVGSMALIIGILNIVAGTWVLQDGVASILYYLKNDNEKWYFNHLVRLLRAFWGLVMIVSGVLLLERF